MVFAHPPSQDGSGEISQPELLAWWRKQKAKARANFDGNFQSISDAPADTNAPEAAPGEPDEEERRLQSIWELVDADGNGTLDKDEVQKIFTGMGQVGRSTFAILGRLSDREA